MTTTPMRQRIRSHQLTSRKDTLMQHVEHRLALILERHELERSMRDADRAVHRRDGSIRLRVGLSIIRLGRAVGGDGLGSPALTG